MTNYWLGQLVQNSSVVQVVTDWNVGGVFLYVFGFFPSPSSDFFSLHTELAEVHG